LGFTPSPRRHRLTNNGFCIVFTKSDKQEIVLFVGSPGAGKSTFYRQNLKPLGFERVNQDALKTKEKCLRVAAAFLEDGKSVTVGELLVGFSLLLLSYLQACRYIPALSFLALDRKHVIVGTNSPIPKTQELT
jgi:hypothetical protein